MKIATDSRMDFDYSVKTEDRFALRKWLEQLVQAINYNDRGVYADLLSEQLTVEGLTEQIFDKQQYLDLIDSWQQAKQIHVIRFPSLKVKYNNQRFRCTGTYEEFVDGILSFEGSVEMQIIKTPENFQLRSLKFYPSFRVTNQRTNNEETKL